MGSRPSKKVSQFTVKDAKPLRFNNDDFRATNRNGTVVKALDNRTDAREDSTDPRVQIIQPQETQRLHVHEGKPGEALLKSCFLFHHIFFLLVAS